MFSWQGELLPGVRGAFTSVAAGNLAFHVGDDADAVRRHRESVRTALGSGPVQYMNQVHGDRVVVVERLTLGDDAPTADGLVSRGLPLAVMVADCVPILLAGTDDDGGPVIAAVHAGRPGMAAGVVPAAVRAMRGLGAHELQAWLGPSVCGRCYEVPAALQEEVGRIVPEAVSTTSWGTPALDIPSGVSAQLERDGVRIRYHGQCTMEDESLYSHRRAPGLGRFAGLIWREGQ
ncbi:MULTISPECIES: polyphenol oxidase family protein [Arthrobacter]|uniref:Polyphenol oxidase family protein n=2 Tax=Arthrobacter TaxID=1663 RepID=A0ABU9KJV7_9MICC|nr:polyphenol oxidase family protein [Arthrobacter sp. YJM1]MDP5226198.1 polyphenol oxidase family protein [Arthrobacter sp. YJM1]